MTIGFLGTGHITTALVTGLCTSRESEYSLWVTPRNREKARLLEKRFPQVRVGGSNQEVVDSSDIVFLAFLPKDRDEILASLQFRDEHIIVNLLSGTTNDEVSALINSQSTVVRAVPLPYAAERIGPIVVYPANDRVDSLFALLGTIIAVEQETQLENLSVITSLMAPYYEMLAHITDWAVQNGVGQQGAAAYTASMFEALSTLAGKSIDGDLYKLADSSMTPGGLNELARKTIHQQGGFAWLHYALEKVKKRVTRQ